MLEKEFNYYVEHQDELVKRFNGRVIVLKGEKVLGDFDTNTDAYVWAEEQGLLGEVMIQLVEPGEESYTNTISSLWIS